MRSILSVFISPFRVNTTASCDCDACLVCLLSSNCSFFCCLFPLAADVAATCSAYSSRQQHQAHRFLPLPQHMKEASETKTRRRPFLNQKRADEFNTETSLRPLPEDFRTFACVSVSCMLL
uniref:Uncharacterized protein n=1 Tax=Leishmania guyanensis TaxID=5670 RepID=A0A1E1J1E9_LEIGU|nr:Hypothetical protein BN36_2640470 [Leishmania guyanensis]CCM16567.1 Hypothetical protein BN36_2640710 [Leishmania guyanensis]